MEGFGKDVDEKAVRWRAVMWRAILRVWTRGL